MDARSASQFELKSIRSPEPHYDVAVLGGGLAGLTFALHMKRLRPETSILVAEKRAEPAPDAAFKVGESTVEVGAYFFREKCGMADHLEAEHLRKGGLRYFFPAGDNSDISRRVEYVTPDQYWNHQIDRGRFENEAFNRAVKLGADAFRGLRVNGVELGEENHTLTLEHDSGAETEVTARWVVDASGRANILRRKLELQAETGHHIDAAWFRLANGFDIESLSDNQEWIDRVDERGFRALATVHLVDTGYWVWLIPLGSGAHSIGVCTDPRFHSFDRDQRLRPPARVVQRARAAARRRDRGPPRRGAGLPRDRGLLLRIDAGVLRASAGRWSERPPGSSTRSTRRARTSSPTRTRSAPI